jgi:hypothetical protein
LPRACSDLGCAERRRRRRFQPAELYWTGGRAGAARDSVPVIRSRG